MAKDSNLPLDYADIRIAADGAIMLAIDYTGLTSKKPVTIRRTGKKIEVVQEGRIYVSFKLGLDSVCRMFTDQTEFVIAQVRKSGKIQVFEQVSFQQV